jgi:cell division transport system ATP-binding protein
MVHLQSVSKSYFGQARVLDQVQLQLQKGDFIYVAGGSGAGKSSLLRMIATEESPTSGRVGLFGYDLGAVAPLTLQAIRRNLGYVPQNVRLLPDLSVEDNVALALSVAGRRAMNADARRRMDELLAKLGLAHLRGKPAGALSGGEAQRVAVARALVREPELIVADEPTGAQDQEFTWTVMDLLLRANLGGATVVVATHDREIVRRVRKRVAVLKGGRLALEEALCIY